MCFEMIVFTSQVLQKQAVNEVMACNDFTQHFGLSLSPEQAVRLIETRFSSLSQNGRIEFGGGVIDKLIKAFCDSPFISEDNYAQTLHELIELFYYYKNESGDLISDDELIYVMKHRFDGVCQGSLELLADSELYRFSRRMRMGWSFEGPEEDLDEDGSDE